MTTVTTSCRPADTSAPVLDTTVGGVLREVVYFTDWAEFMDTGPAEAALPQVSPDDVAQIQYTSGTTGFPKGAELHHRGPPRRPPRPPSTPMAGTTPATWTAAATCASRAGSRT